jgi:hypothetical protein
VLPEGHEGPEETVEQLERGPQRLADLPGLPLTDVGVEQGAADHRQRERRHLRVHVDHVVIPPAIGDPRRDRAMASA